MAPVRGEKGWDPRSDGWEDLGRRKEWLDQYRRTHRRKGGRDFEKRRIHMQRYMGSAGKFPKRKWEPWEEEYLRKYATTGCRILALHLQRSIKSVIKKREEIMEKRWKVRQVDFTAEGRTRKDFRGKVGLYDHKSDVLYVDSRLPAISNGTRRSVLEHEKVHARVHRGGFKLPGKVEERLADLVSLCATPSQYQSTVEIEFKQEICRGLRWSRPRERRQIVAKVLERLEIYSDGYEPLVTALSGE